MMYQYGALAHHAPATASAAAPAAHLAPGSSGLMVWPSMAAAPASSSFSHRAAAAVQPLLRESLLLLLMSCHHRCAALCVLQQSLASWCF
jgi:hypothetical protein